MRYILFLLLFPSFALAQVAGPLPTPFLTSELYQIDRLGSNVVLHSRVSTYYTGPIPAAQGSSCYRPEGSGDWDDNCSPFEALVPMETFQAYVDGTYGTQTVGPLTPGVWCFRSKHRSVSAHIETFAGLSVNGGGGPDSSCCVTIP